MRLECRGFVSQVITVPKPAFTAVIDALPETIPFVGPEALERRSGTAFRARIGANESGFGPSPKVIAAIGEAAQQIWCYPDPENHDLKSALAAHFAIKADEVTVGEGIDGLLGLAVHLFISPGDVVVTSLGAYPTFNYHVAAFGGALQMVPYSGTQEDPTALAAKARETNARIVYLANPDNPMGSYWPAETINAFIKAVPETCLVILDEAYGETAPTGTLPTIDAAQPNLLRFRTFSKAYGMAGMRVGYAFGNARLVNAFNRVRNHFGVNRLAQAAALAALADQDYLSATVTAIAEARDRIATIAQTNGLRALPSATNFVAVDCGRDGDYAALVLTELAQRGVFIRKPMTNGLDHHIRISAAPQAALDILAETLPAALRAAYGSG